MADKTLVVAVRGWTNTGERLLGGRPGGEFAPAALAALQAKLDGATVWAPELDLPMFSMRNAESVARELFAKIDARLAAAPDIDAVVLIGYSVGSLLARRVFCMAHGVDESGERSTPPAAWADKIQRLVMLSGITRGWEFSTASPAPVRFLSPLLQTIARTVGWLKGLSTSSESRTPFIWQLKRGAPFVVATRIQYVSLMASLRGRRIPASAAQRRPSLLADGLPSTVFLLGARDEYISPADCTELGPRSEFAFIELAGSNHSDAVQLAGNDDASRARCERVAAALAEDFAELNRHPWALPAGDIDDYLDPMDLAESGSVASADGGSVEHAVMVIHGIRDDGFWTKRVAREIKSVARRSSINARAPSPSYGYFSMWDFVKPGGRQRATYWFMERYADVRSHFPNSRISFVGHSNGTYIAARALELCPAIKFERIVFAGSVVRRDYRWSRFVDRVGGVLNYVGNRDGVVAFLPAVFEFLRVKFLDVGGAGSFGFLDAEPPPARRLKLGEGPGKPVELSEIRFVEGGHGAAIGEDFWQEIARFVLLDEIPWRSPVIRQERTAALFRWAPSITLVGVAIAATVLTLPVSVAAIVAGALSSSLLEACLSVAAVIASLAISWLFGRFLKAW